MRCPFQASLLLLLTLVSAGAIAAAPIVYPAKGQSAELQQKDQSECQSWAVKNTGVDPVALASKPVTAAPVAPPPPAQGGQGVRGAARGAVGGAAIGAIAGDTGTGAAVGAVVGGVRGRRQARADEAANQQAQANAQAQAQNQAQAQRDDQMASYYRAYGACLEGRGYSVK
jgi:hypothetical protein